MSRLIETDPQVQQEPELEGFEFGYYTFDDLPNIEVANIESTFNSITGIKTKDTSGNNFQGFPISNDVLQKLQQKGVFCKNSINQIEKGNITDGQLYLVKDNFLKTYVIERNNTYEMTVVPRALTGQILRMVHDELEHNGIYRTYTILKRLHYWKGLKPCIEKHIKMCYQCQRRNKQVVKYATLHFDVATSPMQFVSMDLIGESHPPTSRKNWNALTVICMLTGYVFCVPLKTKSSEEFIAYIDNVYSKFGGSLKMVSDIGTKFKNKMFEQISKELGLEYKLYTSPYHPASNGRIERFQAFLKVCIAKHVALQLEWDVLIPLACATYNFIPIEHSKESPLFLMFGRDPVLPLNTLLGPKMRYLVNCIYILSLGSYEKYF